MFQEYIQRLLLITPPILMALTVHECAHAWVANRMGDPTAKMLGRVTLNPIRHLDPLGTIALFFSGMFGWAKPVPINPRNFRDVSKGIMLVSLAGPASNLCLAAVSAIAYKALVMGGAQLAYTMPQVYSPILLMAELSVLMNVSLAIFNLVPIPPLDGSKVLASFLPPDAAFAFARMEQYGFLILIMLIMTGMIGKIISPIVYTLANLLTGGI